MNRAYSDSEYKLEDLYPERVRWHVRSVLNGQYGSVLRDLRSLPINSPSEIETLRNTHQYLCQYYVNGSKDPQRRAILNDIGRKLMTWIRRNTEHIEMEDRPYEKRASTIRPIGELFEEQMDGLLLEKIGELKASDMYSRHFFDTLDLVFDLIWTKLELSSEECGCIINYIEESEDELSSRTIIAALFLGAMEYFDLEKLKAIKECLRGSLSVEVRGTALAALIILGRRHQDELVALHSDFNSEVLDLFEQNDIQTELPSVLKVIFTSYKTTENHRIFKEKILPELSSISDKLQQVMGNNLQDRLDKLQEMDPDKMEEVERLMMESTGDKFSIMRDPNQDVVYHMVTELKTFPFFNKVSHWFMPYDARFPGIDPDNAEALDRLAPILFQGRQIISSDMYSYAFVNAWSNVEETIMMQMQGMPVPDVTPSERGIADVVEDFVFGAYRFYQLSTHARGMKNPFKNSPYVLDGAFLQRKGIIRENDLYDVANLLVRYQQYEMAGWTYERMVCDYMTASAEVWRGMAVANMMRGKDEKALEQLQQAVELEGKTSITTRKIAELLTRLGRREDAVRWLEQGESELPEEEGVLSYERAKLLYQMERYEDALQAAFKANFLADGASEKVVLFLTIILLKLNRAEEALPLIGSDDTMSGEKLMMRGIAELAVGNKSKGIEILRKWMSSGAIGGDLEERLNLLTSYGYEPWEQALLLDVVLNLIDIHEEG